MTLTSSRQPLRSDMPAPAIGSLTVKKPTTQAQSTMTKATTTALLLAATATLTHASTNVAVLELGKKGSVRAVDSANSGATLEGVASFFSALHGKPHRQVPGMSMVPDLFNKPDSSVVIEINGLKMEASETIQKMLDEFTGIFELDGNRGNAIMSKLGDVKTVSLDSLKEKAFEAGTKIGITGFSCGANKENASKLDETLAATIEDLKNHAEANERSLLVHIVMEGNDSERHMARRLEEENQNQGQENEDGQNYNPYYGYGYINAYGDWVTPYKTMFQIQYFNVVVWTSIGLALVLFYTVYLMVFMPLEADTLLFGESAKIVGDD